MNIIMFGCPSVGKGTYTSRLKKIFNLPHISTGDIFRENIKQGTDLGKKAKEFMDAGQLVPDEITINMLKERLEKDDAKNGFFLDGFPRTLAQAKALEKITKIDHVMNFFADKEVIIARVSNRRICKDCGAIFNLKFLPPKEEGKCDKCGGKLYQRPDEKPDIVKQRLKVYEEQTMPVLDFYRKKGIVSDIDGNVEIASPECHIIEDCQAILEKVKQEKQEQKQTKSN